LHTVTRESNPMFYELLRAFKAKTGIGMLLNTSFNRRGEPIVETPRQAIELFDASEMDALVLGSAMLRKPVRESPTLSDGPPAISTHAKVNSADVGTAPDGVL